MALSELCSTRQVVRGLASNMFSGSCPSKYVSLSPYCATPPYALHYYCCLSLRRLPSCHGICLDANTNPTIQLRPLKQPQVQFAQTNKAFLLQSERYQPFPTLTTPCAKNTGFSWLRRKGTTKKALPKKALVRQGRGWH